MMASQSQDFCASCGIVLRDVFFRCQKCGELNCLDCRDQDNACCIECATGIQSEQSRSLIDDPNAVTLSSTNLVANWIADEFLKEKGIDLRTDLVAYPRIVEAAAKAIQELCVSDRINIDLPFISSTTEGPLHLDLCLTKSQLALILKGRDN
jgi:hypothetical protein